jgi:sodium-dependent dicarboxylate transporter 2/3/5
MISLKRLAFWLPPLFFIFCLSFPPGLISAQAWKVVGLMVWILIWWLTEVVPLGMTSLLPLTILPLLQIPGLSLKEIAQPYGSEIVFLFLGGFVLAIALEKWGLHRRIALNIIKATGNEADHIILGFLLSSAILSMWISNTATAIMMLPIASSILKLVEENEKEANPQGLRNFSFALMLSIAYGANLGGTATLIGTPPNLVLAGFLRDNGHPISFLSWFKIGFPFAVIAVICTYFILVKLVAVNRLGRLKEVGQVIDIELNQLGGLCASEKKVLVIFIFTALGWIFSSYLRELSLFKGLSDMGVGLLSAFALFLVPASHQDLSKINGEIRADDQDKEIFLLCWDDMKKIPWDIFFLFGGGLTLAFALEKVGLIHAIGQSLSHQNSNSIMAIFLLTFISLILTEVMSNVALVTVFLPVVAAVAKGNGLPLESLCVPVTIAASCAFMLPMGTPPNAIVFASGKIKMSQMCRAGFFLNLFCVIEITLLTKFLL